MRSNLPQDPLNWKFGELRTKLLAQAMCGQLVAIPATPSLAANYDLAPTTAAYEPLVLPSHWQWTRLDTLGKLITGFTPKPEESSWNPPELLWITPSDLSTNQGPYLTHCARKISTQALHRGCYRLVAPNSVIYSTRASVGHLAIVPQACCTSQGCMALVPNPTMLDSKWAYYALSFYTPAIKRLGRGSTYLEVSKRKLGSILIPLPPLAEQRSICTVLDELMKQVERMEQAYQELSGPITQRLEQKLIELATRGQLLAPDTPAVAITAPDPGQIPAITPEQRPSVHSNAWRLLRLEQVTTHITDGLHKLPPRVEPGQGVPLLAIGNITASGQLDLEHITSWLAPSILTAKVHKVILAHNDVLLSIVGTLGKVGLVSATDTQAPLMLSRSLAVLKPRSELITPQYLALALRAPALQTWLATKATGTKHKHITIAQLKSAHIPVPPLSEQQRIVACLDELLPWLTRFSSLDDLLQ